MVIYLPAIHNPNLPVMLQKVWELLQFVLHAGKEAKLVRLRFDLPIVKLKKLFTLHHHFHQKAGSARQTAIEIISQLI